MGPRCGYLSLKVLNGYATIIGQVCADSKGGVIAAFNRFLLPQSHMREAHAAGIQGSRIPDVHRARQLLARSPGDGVASALARAAGAAP